MHFYQDRLWRIVEEKKEQLPQSYKIELKHLLNPGNVVSAQLLKLEEEIEKLKLRIEENKKQIHLTDRLQNEGMALDQILEQVELKYPYELNNQKSMKDIFKGVGSEVKFQDIIEAPRSRVKTLWLPTLNYLETIKKQIKDLNV